MAMGEKGPPSGPAQPTPEQAAWHDTEIGMFIHFAPNTWQDREYDDLSTPLSAINPGNLDTDQWVSAAEALGAKYVVFVAKHVGGFCWWQTDTTEYSVPNIPWRSGKGDVLADLAESCRRRAMRLGVYLSPADKHMHAGVGGRCSTEEEQLLYNKVYRKQLSEILSRYEDMFEVWFDGSIVIDVQDLLERYAPKAMIFQGPCATIRWVGNEEGLAPYPAWNALSLGRARSGVATAYDSDPDGEAWMPIECDAMLRDGWFWKSHNEHSLKSVEKLMEMYYRSVGYGAVLLLNQTPDTSGLIPATDVQRGAEFGAEIRRRFGRSVAETRGTGEVVELVLDQATPVDHVITLEDIRGGERVRQYVIEGYANGDWHEICQGTAIGHKKIDRFKPVEVSRVRLRCTKTAAEPLIRRFAVYSVYGAEGVPAVILQAANASAKIWEWTPAAVGPEWATVDIDLTPFCSEACQYEVEFSQISGHGPLEFRSVSLVADGQEVPEFVKKAWLGARYNVTVTGVGIPLHLRAVVRMPEGSNSHGEVTVRKRVV